MIVLKMEPLPGHEREIRVEAVVAGVVMSVEDASSVAIVQIPTDDLDKLIAGLQEMRAQL